MLQFRMDTAPARKPTRLEEFLKRTFGNAHTIVECRSKWMAELQTAEFRRALTDIPGGGECIVTETTNSITWIEGGRMSSVTYIHAQI